MTSTALDRCTTRVRLRAQRHVDWLRVLWESTPGGLGLSISYHEVERILAATDVASAESAFRAGDPATNASIEAADAVARSDPMLSRLRDEFDLDDSGMDLLMLALAIEADPWLRRVYAFIHDDATGQLATPWLGRQLFDWPGASTVGPDSNLCRWRLAGPLGGQADPWSVTAAWAADPYVVRWLDDPTDLDPALGASVSIVDAAAAPRLCIYPDVLASMDTFARSIASHDVAGEIVLTAPTGAGKRTLATQFGAALEQPVLAADAGTLLGEGVDHTAAADAVMRVERCARLFGATIHWHDAELPLPHRDRRPGTVELRSCRDDPAEPATVRVVRRTLHLPALRQADRRALWSTLSSEAVPQAILDWTLLPADVARAAAAAGVDPASVRDACRATSLGEIGALATALVRPYTWDDLVLQDSVEEHLREIETQARLRWPVYEEWGFERLCPAGRGIAALFAGPSGTGKTMAAQVLARSLDMELYRVDLAAVVSKYIGETEKHLQKVFDVSERSNVILFFDEADALFGQRTEVKDAHDRFANIEIDFLLQRMERFEGLTVLATNRKQDIDAAFLRRFRFIVDFLVPGVEERHALWQRVLPRAAPNGETLLESVDVDRLASTLSMTGADITSAALGAAFLARGEGKRIGMAHVFHAARRELAKRGQVLRMVEQLP